MPVCVAGNSTRQSGVPPSNALTPADLEAADIDVAMIGACTFEDGFDPIYINRGQDD